MECMGRFTLKALAEAAAGECTPAAAGLTEITAIVSDSRKASAGALFAAVTGTKLDGNRYLEDAFSRGAAAALTHDRAALAGRPGIIVKDARIALSRLASFFAGNPSAALKVVGITGTNGKTTIHWQLYHAFQRLGMPAMRIGTLGFEGPGLKDDASMTTPDPLLLQEYLRKGLDAGAAAAAMEVSSHALAQHRADDVLFDAAIFTNLTRDHLDYHETMEAYYAAKKRLFELMAAQPKAAKSAVINIDDEYGRRLRGELQHLGPLSYGASDDADLRPMKFEQSYSGSRYLLSYGGLSLPVGSRLIGWHNAMNTTAAVGALLGLGFPAAEAVAAVNEAPPVPGRLEPVGNEELGVFVDYAHTPDALENVLRTLQALEPKNLWVVFGCGGDRDRGKRPQMARIAAQYANKVVVTSDNPRTEDPDRIIADILSEGVKPAIVDADRRQAIAKALAGAGAGDVVLIAGKGHEDYQIIGHEKFHFSDQEEVRKILAN